MDVATGLKAEPAIRLGRPRFVFDRKDAQADFLEKLKPLIAGEKTNAGIGSLNAHPFQGSFHPLRQREGAYKEYEARAKRFADCVFVIDFSDTNDSTGHKSGLKMLQTLRYPSNGATIAPAIDQMVQHCVDIDHLEVSYFFGHLKRVALMEFLPATGCICFQHGRAEIHTAGRSSRKCLKKQIEEETPATTDVEQAELAERVKASHASQGR